MVRHIQVLAWQGEENIYRKEMEGGRGSKQGIHGFSLTEPLPGRKERCSEEQLECLRQRGGLEENEGTQAMVRFLRCWDGCLQDSHITAPTV